MQKASMCAVALASATMLISNSAYAQNGTPSTKATAAISTAVACTIAKNVDGVTIPVTECHDIFTGASAPVSNDHFVTVMATHMKVSNSQSLFVSPSLVTGLYTQTKTRTTTGSESTATAQGGVYLRAKITNRDTGVVQIGEPVASCTAANMPLGCYQDADGELGVTLNTRVQTLTQAISACIIDVADFGDSTDGTCTFESTIDLILKTTSAHTFNFIFPNVGQGVYDVEIQAAVNAGASVSGLGTATGAAAYGLGSVTVESVRLVHDFEF